MSYWDHVRPVRRTRAVAASELARVSADLLDAGGRSALTVRAVATALGVSASSIYSRVASVDDLLDLALDHVMGQDEQVRARSADGDLDALMVAYFRHLLRHPWACQVIAMRPPRGPHYIRLSERMCVLLVAEGVADPLGTAYALTNFVIGSASTTAMADDERAADVDAGIAPVYARLHADHAVAPEEILRVGLRALRAAG